MTQLGGWLYRGACIGLITAMGGPAYAGFRLAEASSPQATVFRNQNPGRENTAPTLPQNKQPRVVAYCVLPGAKDRFVITSDAQLIQITEAGEATVIGVVIAPVSSEYLCMIRTERTLIGVNSSGHLVNTEDGAVVGAVVPVPPPAQTSDPSQLPPQP